MPRPLHTLPEILQLACGRAVDADAGVARRWQLVLGSILLGVALSALWGLAAGSTSPALALGNGFKVPLVVTLSAVVALPAGLLALKLTGAAYRATDLTVSFASGILGGTLVLAALAPLVALYDQTSVTIGSRIAVGSAILALLVGVAVLARNVLRRRPPGTRRRAAIFPASVLVLMQLATLLQLIALASPILPHDTPFEGGVDQLIGSTK
jgi:lysylphosphatidylglycerol synthetase-like protein (DUF2156 family)